MEINITMLQKQIRLKPLPMTNQKEQITILVVNFIYTQCPIPNSLLPIPYFQASD